MADDKKNSSFARNLLQGAAEVFKELSQEAAEALKERGQEAGKPTGEKKTIGTYGSARRKGAFLGNTNVKPNSAKSAGAPKTGDKSAGEKKNHGSKAAAKPAVNAEERVRADLNRRNRLEESILSLIGGKTGMSMTWDEIGQCAVNGDESGFLLFAGSFHKKAEMLKKELEELMGIIEAAQKTNYPGRLTKNEMAGRVALPFRHEEECRMLLDNSEQLVKSGFLDALRENKKISIEELTEWGSRFTMKEDGNNE